MTYKELMICSLTSLLEDGESLLYPIYGCINQGNKRYYGFFGCTENYLLIALINGKRVTYTTRIPLDIKSISINKTLLFKEHNINISFNEGNPCIITASPRVLTINTQKDNFSKFLRFLEGKSSKKHEPPLKGIKGEKIRRQYFNVFIYLMIAFSVITPIFRITTELIEGNFDMVETIKDFPVFFVVICILLLPFIILSLLNRFCFGKIIGVADDYGLHLQNDIIPWNDINTIVFKPRVSSKRSLEYTYVTIFVKPQNKMEYSYDVMHFPLYGLRKIKKHSPQVKIKMDVHGKFLIAYFALMPSLLVLFVTLFM